MSDDNKPGLPTKYISKHHVMSEYQHDIAVALLDYVAMGKTIKQIAEMENMPTRQTIHRWLTLYKEFSSAYWAAKELSASVLEDEALAIAHKLCDANEFTGTRIQALKEAMVQFRWSAARRDPKRYGGNAPVTAVTVPIQINTNLDLNSEADVDGYSFTARLATPVEGDSTEGGLGVSGDEEEEEDEPMPQSHVDVNTMPDVEGTDPYNTPTSVPAVRYRPPKKPKPKAPPKPVGRRLAHAARQAKVVQRMAKAKAEK